MWTTAKLMMAMDADRHEKIYNGTVKLEKKEITSVSCLCEC